MNKSIRLIYCIFGSVMLVLLSHPIPYDVINGVFFIGTELSVLTEFISAIGVILTAIFAVMLTKENCIIKNK
ncbi:hypothetical protein CLPUN_12390 [Clostridium puniceum]|uniref:Uncharacterized protein n=1 Tax=Clostridium puniceum TaxID=29367 RepID=A0A1S8TTC5_9CLOT|nr:hypothetical protein [Clostridium puniceum]OOM80862.1 hypothetical protein CLPUN_12390 [Clostridium puniceum]